MGIPRIIIRSEDVKRNGECLVYIRYIHKGKRVLFSTETLVNKKDLLFQAGVDGKKKINQLNFLSKSTQGYTWKKSRIIKKLTEVQNIVKKIEDAGNEPTTTLVSRHLADSTRKSEKGLQSIYEIYNSYIEEATVTKTKSTIKQYRSSLQHLRNFFQDKPISIDLIQDDFYDDYLKYLLRDLNMSNNTVGNQIKNIKAFLNWTNRKGYPVQIDTSRLKVFKEKPIIVYLSQDELHKIHSLLLDVDNRLNKVRDLLILSCQTGLRISDLKRLGQEHIRDGVIKMKAHKNKNELTIPLRPEAAKILTKWNYDLPMISEPKYNIYIKELCQLAGINSPSEVTVYQGGKKTYKKVPKYQLVTSHIGTKTFITHCLEKGISPKVVSEMTGKSVKTIIDHYYGTSEKVIKLEMDRAFGIFSTPQ